LSASTKKAQTIAKTLIGEVISRGWPVGERLGSGTELQQRFNAGRNVVREAIRIIEREGIVVSRRGGGGGLFIAAPAENAVVNTVTNYLELTNISQMEVHAAWREMQEHTVKLALENITLPSISRLEQITKKLAAAKPTSLTEITTLFWEALTTIDKLTENPIIPLFTHPLFLLSTDYRDKETLNSRKGRSLLKENLKAVESLLLAMKSANHLKAFNHLETLFKNSLSMAQLPDNKKAASMKNGKHSFSQRVRLDTPGKDKNSSAEDLAFTIQSEIAVHNWSVGKNLGTEPGLISRYRVSRSILREAVRLLENFSIVEMRRGKGGGLVVAEPNPAATIEMAVLYLDYMQLKVEDLLALRQLLEQAVAASTARCLSETGKQLIEKALAEELQANHKTFVDKAHRLSCVIANQCGNRALALFFTILAETTRHMVTAKTADRVIESSLPALKNGHAKIVEAIFAYEPAAAQAAVAKHRKKVYALYTQNKTNI